MSAQYNKASTFQPTDCAPCAISSVVVEDLRPEDKDKDKDKDLDSRARTRTMTSLPRTSVTTQRPEAETGVKKYVLK